MHAWNTISQQLNDAEMNSRAGYARVNRNLATLDGTEMNSSTISLRWMVMRCFPAQSLNTGWYRDEFLHAKIKAENAMKKTPRNGNTIPKTENNCSAFP